MLWLSSAVVYGANPWALVQGPSDGPAQAIGTYTNGCVVGATQLAPSERGLEVMRWSRQRHFGHPLLLKLVRDLAQHADTQAWGTLLVGDLGQARGGPTFTNHISHQSGLDADIWFRTLRPARAVTMRERESLNATQYVNWRARKLDPSWGEAQSEMLRFAAKRPEVQRIFVSPVIKHELCRGTAKPRVWLQKIRPWFGHGDHMHVRLLCPPGSPDCALQAPVPNGDGCGAELESWLQPQRPSKKPAKKKPRKAKLLPARCIALLRIP